MSKCAHLSRVENQVIEYLAVSDNSRQHLRHSFQDKKILIASMCMLGFFLRYGTLIVISSGVAGGKRIKDRPTVNVSDEYRLMGDLLMDYDTNARPRYNSSDFVEVFVRFSLQQIYDLDEKRQILTISGWLTAEWKDDFLTWNPSEYGGTKSVVVHPNKIWTPKMAIGNSATTMFQDWRHFLVTVRHNGMSRWQPGGNFAFTCALDMNYYPFDEQKCTMELETWYYTADKVHLRNKMDKFGLETYLQHGEWAVVDTEVKQTDMVYGYYADEAFPEVYFSIMMHRKYTFYFMYILLPCIMLSVVLLMVFLLPSESGEKVSLGVSILVAFSLFLLIVAEQVPDTSDAVPIMAIYLMYFMMATALSVMTSTLILKLHYGGFDRDVPGWLRILMFDMVAPILCLQGLATWSRHHRKCVHRQMEAELSCRRSEMNGQCRNEPNVHDALKRTLSDACEQQSGADENSTAERSERQRVLKRTLSIEFVNYATISPLGHPTRYNFSSQVDRGQCCLTSVEFQTLEWKKLSEVLDRLFFWLFLLFILMPIIGLVGLVRVFRAKYQV